MNNLKKKIYVSIVELLFRISVRRRYLNDNLAAPSSTDSHSCIFVVAYAWNVIGISSNQMSTISTSFQTTFIRVLRCRCVSTGLCQKVKIIPRYLDTFVTPRNNYMSEAISYTYHILKLEVLFLKNVFEFCRNWFFMEVFN